MALSFQHATKLIDVPQADAAPLLIQTLINAIRDEEASERGIAYDQIAVASGKEDLGGGVYTGITVGLLSTWKLNFAAGAYQATVDGGNLADALARVQNTGNPQVLMRASAAATLVSGTGGLTAGEVWAHSTATTLTTQVGELHDLDGLDASNPLTVTPTSRDAGSISQTIGQVGDTVTVTRT